MEAVYYANDGYWHGETAVNKLSERASVTKSVAREWLSKQPVWQIYQPAPKHIPRGKIAESIPNAVHQADLLYLPHDKVKDTIYKYGLCVIDVATRYKACEPISDKTAKCVAAAIKHIYAHTQLKYPKLIQVDAGTEFRGAFATHMKNVHVKIRVATPGFHRAQAIVERFNRTLAERLFTKQYHTEIQELYKSGRESSEWVDVLPSIIDDLNASYTRLISMSPNDAMKLESVSAKASAPVKGQQEKYIPIGTKVRYLYLPGELYNGQERRRATDPIWSLTLHQINSVQAPSDSDGEINYNSSTPIYYGISDDIYDDTKLAPHRKFVRQELLIVPYDTAQI